VLDPRHCRDGAALYDLLMTRTDRPRLTHPPTFPQCGVAPVIWAVIATPAKYQRTHHATRREILTVCCAITGGSGSPCPAASWRHGIQSSARSHRVTRTGSACSRRRLRHHRTGLPCGPIRSHTGKQSAHHSARSADQQTKDVIAALAACGL